MLNVLTQRVKHLSFPGTTTVVQTNLLTSNIATNRLIRWDEINFPETWSLENHLDPDPILNRNIDQIIQNTEGDVEIRFQSHSQRVIKLPRSISSRYSRSEDKDYHPCRSSTSVEREEFDTIETIKIGQNQILQGIYQTHKSNDSLTQSEMSFGI
jgi:hypothetical protein